MARTPSINSPKFDRLPEAEWSVALSEREVEWHEVDDFPKCDQLLNKAKWANFVRIKLDELLGINHTFESPAGKNLIIWKNDITNDIRWFDLHLLGSNRPSDEVIATFNLDCKDQYPLGLIGEKMKCFVEGAKNNILHGDISKLFDSFFQKFFEVNFFQSLDFKIKIQKIEIISESCDALFYISVNAQFRHEREPFYEESIILRANNVTERYHDVWGVDNISVIG